MKAPITAVIIARDAADTIGECVSALSFCRRVLVGENGSRDQTAAKAAAAGAEVRHVAWEGYGRTKNALMAGISDGWILSVDADEIVTPALADSLARAVGAPGAVRGFWLSRRNFFLGREIKHGGWSPDWQLRLFAAGAGAFEERAVHEALRVAGPTARLSGALNHQSYRSLGAYLQRMNHYTTLAAADRQVRGKHFSWLRLLFDPIWTFKKMYVLKGGWQDGFPGFALAWLSALNTLVKHAKHWEAASRSARRGAIEQ